MLPRTRTVRGVSEAVLEGNRDETVEDADKVCRTGVVAIAKDNSRFNPPQTTNSVRPFFLVGVFVYINHSTWPRLTEQKVRREEGKEKGIYKKMEEAE